jgi:UDP-glucose 4-epimerase
MQRKLILGATGFIGGNLVKTLVARGEYPRILVRPSSSLSFMEDILDGIEIVYGDFQDNECLRDATKDIDVVFHLISTTSPSSPMGSSLDDALNNLLPTIRLVENAMANGVQKIVYTSSGGTVYGEPQIIPIPEEHTLFPKSVYGQSKLTIENFLNFYARSTTLDVNILRISNPFGAGQNPLKAQGIIAVAMNCAYSNQVLKLYGNGQAVRDYLYIDDVTEALILAAQKPGSSIVNISSGIGYSVRDIVQAVEEVSGRIIRKEFIPARSSDVSVNILSNQRAFEIYGWSPKIGLYEGLARLDDMRKAKRRVTLERRTEARIHPIAVTCGNP